MSENANDLTEASRYSRVGIEAAQKAGKDGRNAKKTMNTLLNLTIATVALQCASAVQIQPMSYLADKAADSSLIRNYTDQTGSQLIDGAVGTSYFPADLGNGPAYEWVGWNIDDKVINIDFTFSQLYQFNEVKVHTVQSGIGNIPLPSVDLYKWNGSTWDLLAFVSNSPENAANDGARWISLGGFGEESSLLRVTLKQAVDGPWTFASEVQFFGEQSSRTNVPDGGSTALLLGLGALALGMLKRKL